MRDFITYAEELANRETRIKTARQETLCNEFERYYRFHGAEFELNQDYYTKDDVQYLRDTYGLEGWNFKLLGGDIVVKFNSSKFPLSAVEQGIATIAVIYRAILCHSSDRLYRIEVKKKSPEKISQGFSTS